MTRAGSPHDSGGLQYAANDTHFSSRKAATVFADRELVLTDAARNGESRHKLIRFRAHPELQALRRLTEALRKRGVKESVLQEALAEARGRRVE